MSDSLTQVQFLQKYNISQEDFKKTGLQYEELKEIQADYASKFQMYDDAGANLVRILLRFDSIHSVKYRVKDSEHLLEKIIRKKISKPSTDITLANYAEKIQDLIGIRIMHLFKSDWPVIHEKLKDNFKFVQKPEANLREGDSKDYFKGSGCKIKTHDLGYRSVHYIIKTEPTLKALLAEIQVRTILEEAWSEIDHKVRYPYNLDNSLLNQYLRIFNRLAGSADEMDDYVLSLNNDFIAKEERFQEQQAQIKKLQQELNKSSLKPGEKDSINDMIKNIEKLTSKGSLSDFTPKLYGSTFRQTLKELEQYGRYQQIIKRYPLPKPPEDIPPPLQSA